MPSSMELPSSIRAIKPLWHWALKSEIHFLFLFPMVPTSYQWSPFEFDRMVCLKSVSCTQHPKSLPFYLDLCDEISLLNTASQ